MKKATVRKLNKFKNKDYCPILEFFKATTAISSTSILLLNGIQFFHQTKTIAFEILIFLR